MDAGGRVVEVNPLRDRRWDDYVRTAAESEFYHLSAWSDVMQQTYGFLPNDLAVENTAGQFHGVLPLFLTQSPLTGRKLLSLPFSDVAGPVAETADIRRLLLQQAIDLAQQSRVSSLQVRTARGDLASDEPRLVADRRFVTYVIPLDDPSHPLWDKPALATVRRRVRLTQRQGVTLRVGATEGDLRAFYQLHLQTTKRHGMPAQPFAFFQNLWRLLPSSCELRLVLAMVERQVIGGSLFVGFRDCVSYLFGASDPAAHRYQPSYPMLWDALAWAEREGYRRFSLGKTSTDNPGLQQFKQRWGGVELPLFTYFYPQVAGFSSSAYGETQRTARLIARLWRALPDPITTRVGGLLYGHLA